MENIPTHLAWIDIPEGNTKIKRYGTFQVKSFKIAKYPITNIQYALFVNADGYNQKHWWTDLGWQERQKGKWNTPRYWNDNTWSKEDKPVVGISWYEALAFCKWLGETSHTLVTLPTEDQWQRAAQGDDFRIYPWGNKWDFLKCNNSQTVKYYGGFFRIGARKIRSTVVGQGERTTTVTAYEGIGDSPFGVVDMAGNVWEWCLTDSRDRSNNTDISGIQILPHTRVFRGGSWYYSGSRNVRCDYRYWHFPISRTNNIGFRPVLLI